MLDVTKVYDRLEKAIKKKKYKIFVLRGGTRSSKTYSLMQLIFKRLITGNIGNYYHKNGKLDIVRKHSATLRATARLDFLEIKQNFLDDESNSETTKYLINTNMGINKTEMTISFFGRTVNFMGADNWAKLKGGKRVILVCNEASELAYKTEFYQLLMRTTGLVFVDFNPDDEEIRINTELEQKRALQKKDVYVDISTYKDNNFLEKAQVEEIEYMKETDSHLWKVYGLGQYGVLVGRIFRFEIKEIPKQAKFLGYGLDRGYTNDPTAFEGIRQYGNEIYIDELIYETGLRNSDISDRFTALGVDKWEEIIADSAEPKSIDDLCDDGWNVKPATKGPDSIRYGIDVMKKYKLFITPLSDTLVREFKKYTWITDKNGKSLNVPIDKYNHGIDGIRYLITEKLGKKDDTPMVY